MKHLRKFLPVREVGFALLLLGFTIGPVLQAQDMWILPQGGTWIEQGQTGSATDPGLIVVVYQNQILLVSPSAVQGFLQLGGRLGWPNVVVPMIVDGNPTAVPIAKVAGLLKRGAQVSGDLVIMHKGAEQIAVPKSQVDQYKAKGYEMGPRDGWTEGVVMCFKDQLVVVDINAVEKYKGEGAQPGPCPR